MAEGLAIIGNCSYNALIKEGSIEWLCWPRPDSSFVFGPLLALVILTAPALEAQVLYGSVVGNVKDAQGASIPAATVTVTNKETNLVREAVTNENGDYTIANVVPACAMTLVFAVLSPMPWRGPGVSRPPSASTTESERT